LLLNISDGIWRQNILSTRTNDKRYKALIVTLLEWHITSFCLQDRIRSILKICKIALSAHDTALSFIIGEPLSCVCKLSDKLLFSSFKIIYNCGKWTKNAKLLSNAFIKLRFSKKTQKDDFFSLFLDFRLHICLY
jgi:hypothetical protein